MRLREATYVWQTFEHGGESVRLHLASLTASERLQIATLVQEGSVGEAMRVALQRGVHDWEGMTDAAGKAVPYHVDAADTHFGSSFELTNAFSAWLFGKLGLWEGGLAGEDPSTTPAVTPRGEPCGSDGSAPGPGSPGASCGTPTTRP